MTLSIPIPENLDAALVRRLDQEAREAVAVRLYREGKLSHGKVAEYLGIGRSKVDEVLGRHERFDEFTADEISQQAQTLTRLREAGSR